MKPIRWVELPDCKGVAGEVPLPMNPDTNTGATNATCKVRGDNSTAAHVEPGATPAPSLSQRNTRWVELPDCASKDDAGALNLEPETNGHQA